ncbi:hypothetical protein ATPR_3364 [Acetobacter tropicalis NBRC 101654]|uniref:Uncharacterized protein n=1 Tax=Acetobacter tropicalis NBRC 101654 TaxID=749388 RepID=F7VJ15_9PROT|nr:hypothetical protein ATPR_3364 [Acetobacter tropicalis NBRC 101654]
MRHAQLGASSKPVRAKSPFIQPQTNAGVSSVNSDDSGDEMGGSDDG